MYKRLSSFLVRFLLKEKTILPEDIELYSFGFESIIISAGTAFLLFMVGIITHSLYESLIYYFVLWIMRKYSGGYHASTCVRCNAIYLMTYLVALRLSNMWQTTGIPLSLIILLLVFIVLSIVLFAPIVHPNNPLSESQKKRHRISAICIAALLSIIDLILFFLGVDNYMFLLLVMVSAVIYMYVEIIKRIGGTKSESS